MRQAVSRGLAWVALIHVVLFMAFWLTNGLFYAEVNDYLTDLLGQRLDFVRLCLIVSGAVGLWSGARGLFALSGRQHRLDRLTAWLYGIVAFVYIAFFYGSFWLLLRKSPVQLPRLAQMLLYFRVILDPALLIAATLLVSVWVRRRLRAQNLAGIKPYFVTLAPVLIAYVLLWAIPIMAPPDSIYGGTLPPKPRIVAHRGASMLAPENTVAAFQRAIALGAYGIETDISLSRDGVPFLMHDDTLARTTNVAQVFPERENDLATSFALPELKQLNAGVWFVESDPYQAIARGAVTAEQVEQYRRQTVPVLAEVLEIVRQSPIVFIFDLKEPTNAPSGQSFFDLVFRRVHETGIDSQVWFLVDRERIDVVRAAPEMQPAYGVDFRQPPDAAALADAGYEIVNAEYGLAKEWIRAYRAAGLWVNLYTIDEPWQYSRLWLLGVESTTSSNAQALLAQDHPLLSLPYSQYVLLWTAVGVLGLGVLVGTTWRAYRR